MKDQVEAKELTNISETARAFGVTHRTLRFYEQKELLEPLREGNTRLYRPEDRDRIEAIRNAAWIGLSLEEIHKYLDRTQNRVVVPHEMLEERLLEMEKAAREAARRAEDLRQTLYDDETLVHVRRGD